MDLCPPCLTIINIDGKVTQGDSFQSFFSPPQTFATQQPHHPSVVQELEIRSPRDVQVPGSFFSQALSPTQFPGERMRCIDKGKGGRGFLLDPLSPSQCATKRRWVWLPREASLGDTGQREHTGSQTRRPGLGYLLQPRPPDVCFANCSQMRHLGQLSPAVPETQQPKANFCPGEGLQVCTWTPCFFSA